MAHNSAPTQWQCRSRTMLRLLTPSRADDGGSPRWTRARLCRCCEEIFADIIASRRLVLSMRREAIIDDGSRDHRCAKGIVPEVGESAEVPVSIVAPADIESNAVWNQREACVPLARVSRIGSQPRLRRVCLLHSGALHYTEGATELFKEQENSESAPKSVGAVERTRFAR